MTYSTEGASSGLARLFEPVEIAGLRLRNRIVMAPMTRSFSPGGVPGPDVAAYYRRRAENDVGLIITEGAAVERPSAANDPAVPHFHGEAALAGWARVREAVHAAGGRIWPQLWHVGALRSGSGSWRPPQPFESPSGVSRPGRESGVAMSEADVEATIAAFGRAGADAKRLGFDGVELHGAHGYLIDQFFWDGSNQRTDRFGGATVAERTRFACEVIRAARPAAARARRAAPLGRAGRARGGVAAPRAPAPRRPAGGAAPPAPPPRPRPHGGGGGGVGGAGRGRGARGGTLRGRPSRNA